MKIINLISGPRNISTALMYSFAQRNDTVVLDEPYYAVYLVRSGAGHPGKEEVIGSLPGDEQGVMDLIHSASVSPVLFIKNMAHHMEVLHNPVIEHAIQVFLIRDPLHIITSYSQVIEKPVMRDIGIAYQYSLFESLGKKGKTPIVLDSGMLLEDPRAVLMSLCERCGIGYQESMLQWPAGPKSYDGVWAPYWYGNVHSTTRFQRQVSPARPLTGSLKPLYEEARSYYEKLLPFSLKA